MYRVFGSGVHRTCQTVSRREVLQVGAAGALGLSLADVLRAREAGAATPAADRDINCIMLFLWGGPPQHETWDPKPDAPEEIAGPVKPIPTSVDGIRIGELLPRMAQLAHEYLIVRSAHHDDDVHGNGCHFNLTGLKKQPNVECPNMGAVVDRFRGARGAVPAFVTVGPVMRDAPVWPTGQEGGFLGNSHQPFRILDPTAPVSEQPALSPPPGLSVDRLVRRSSLREGLDRLQQLVETDATRGFDTAYQRAFSLTTSPRAKQAFDLERESAGTREAYGEHRFGRGCLLARRLVEAGARFVQINWAAHPIEEFGYDNHSDNYPRLKDHQLPVLDQAASALISDLIDRGLYERTLVLITGEFGRTPKINPHAGRDHWPYVYSYVMGGAGIPGGRVIGASDAHGAYPDSTPVTPEMRAVSIYEMMGLDTAVTLRQEGLVTDSRAIPGLFGDTA